MFLFLTIFCAFPSGVFSVCLIDFLERYKRRTKTVVYGSIDTFCQIFTKVVNRYLCVEIFFWVCQCECTDNSDLRKKNSLKICQTSREFFFTKKNLCIGDKNQKYVELRKIITTTLNHNHNFVCVDVASFKKSIFNCDDFGTSIDNMHSFL